MTKSHHTTYMSVYWTTHGRINAIDLTDTCHDCLCLVRQSPSVQTERITRTEPHWTKPILTQVEFHCSIRVIHRRRSFTSSKKGLVIHRFKLLIGHLNELEPQPRHFIDSPKSQITRTEPHWTKPILNQVEFHSIIVLGINCCVTLSKKVLVITDWSSQ